jgi:transposase
MIKMAKKNSIPAKIKKEEKKAKQEIQAAMQQVEALMAQPIEEQISKAKDTMMSMIRLQEAEDLINQEIEFTGRNALIKKRLVHLYVSGKYSTRQLAQIFCVSEKTIWAWLREPDVKDAIARFQEEQDIIIKSMMKALAVTAVERQRELIESADNEMVSAIMIRDLLDRTGFKPVEKKQVEVNMTYEERLQQLIEGVQYEVIEDEPSDLSQSKQISTEGEKQSD